MSYALTFTVTVPSVTNACYIAGNFNGWNPTTHKMTKIDTNKYQIEIDTQGSSVQYKYCSGPGWEYVEKNSSGGEIGNRSYKANDVVARWASVYNPDAVQISFQKHTFETFLPLQGTRRIIIYLPPDYEVNTEKRYPVLYMHDGQNIFEQGAFGSWRMQDALQSLYDSGKNVGIVVGIDNGAGRMSEYTPFPNFQYASNPTGNDYLQAIINNVIPYINSNYRTLADRENTGICGSSLGGLISYYAGLKHNDIFGRVGVVSPAFWYCKNDLNNYVSNWMGENAVKTKIYFICGDNEGSSSMVSDMQSFYNLTGIKGFKNENLYYEVVAGGQHNEAAWSQQIKRVYEFLFQNNTSAVPTKNDDFRNISISTTSEALNISSSIENLSLILYNSSGQKIYDKNILNNLSIPLRKGVYIAKMNVSNKMKTCKIVVP
ncbi:alpha/beta hydrolase-fold protein [Paludibacter sp.]